MCAVHVTVAAPMRRSVSSTSTSSQLPRSRPADDGAGVRQRLQVSRVSVNIITFVIMFTILAQSVAAMTTVVAIQVVTVPMGLWRDRIYHCHWFIQLNTHAATRFLRVFPCFLPIKNLLGRTEMRTHERKDQQSILTV